jgi:hypothetical protein
MKCDRAGHLLTTDAMSAAQTLRKLTRSAGLSRPDPAQVQSMAAKRLQRVYAAEGRRVDC